MLDSVTSEEEQQQQPQPRLVSRGGPLNAERGATELELERLVRHDGTGLNEQALNEIVNRLNTLPGCRVCAQLLADVRVLLISIYQMQERSLKIAENRLEDDEAADSDLCCCCTINIR